MLEAIKEILGSPAGSASFVLGIMVLAGWIIHYVTKFTTTITAKYGLFDERMAKTESNIDEIRKDIAYIKGSFEATVGIKDVLTKKKSPITLTEIGKQIADSNNLNAMVDSNWSKISIALNGLKTNNPYDIQEFCIETAFVESNKFFSNDDISRLKLISYKSGVSLFSITRLMGVLIRDRYFNENGIDVGEVDQYDPNSVNT